MSFRLGLRATVPSSSSSAISSASLVLRRPIQTSPLSRASHPAASASQSYIKGTVNDPTTYPPPNAAHGHQHWAVERAISVALLPLTAVAFAKHGASGFLDVALGLSLVAHSHIGFDSIFNDYLHKRKFPIAGRIWPWGIRAAAVGAIAGLYEMQTNDVGLTELCAKLWTA